ncbi:ABC transporter ATP-binding protein [Acuticoccus kandeliae]|uniref:ABC transporter ATP-binding protein n=1 Tax=Acuticoccus kandeliae TaxID=2073160 RepID=UPI00196AB280|nr:ABC transporter ATP-binding protein [Acuticoccus kandeliae]
MDQRVNEAPDGGGGGATTMPPESRLSICGLHKTYRKTAVSFGRRRPVSSLTALSDISFDVAPNSVVTLLGPSGCGKTTLLRIIAGLGKADSGSLLLDGKPVTGPSKDKAFVFQHFGLLPWRTVIDNVAFPMELDGVPLSERRDVAERYIRLVGLAGFEQHHPHALSGGMQQRVGIARALTRDPRLLLMDEPFGALDAQTREILQEELINILATTHNTVVCVTHSIAEAVMISDRVVVFTPSPGTIKRIIDIPPRARGAEGRLSRTAPELKEIESELRELLREGHGE